MSVTTFGYLIDLDKLRSAVGSNDPGLRRAVEDHFADHLRENEQIVATHHPGEATIRQALGELIAGDLPADCQVEHLLAFEILCMFLGERLDDDDRLADLDDLEIPTRLLESGPPVELPGFEDRVGFLTPEEAAQEWSTLKGADLSWR